MYFNTFGLNGFFSLDESSTQSLWSWHVMHMENLMLAQKHEEQKID